METQNNPERQAKKIKRLLIFFSGALIFSGITAIPVKWELQMLSDMRFYLPTEIGNYLMDVKENVDAASINSPQLFYGFDWLAFAHVIIALFFIGPIKDPIKNLWVIEAGMIACVLIFPFALIAGHFRGIPFLWQCVDCSFGVIGIIPLYYARKLTLILEGKTISKKYSTTQI
ncbi:MAG: hypothetical protein IAF38_10050 [Bacteroidia bacterium]|nr:hypothetical protein [Bacteroidia bacterium]